MPSPLTLGDDNFESGLRELAGMLLGGETAQSVLSSVVSLAGRVLPNCQAASISLLRDGHPSTPVCSAELACELDRSQYDSGHGPCLHAIHTGAVIRGHAMADNRSWPEFSAQAVRCGVMSSLPLPPLLPNAVAVQRAEDLARHLTVALEHRDIIGQTKGSSWPPRASARRKPSTCFDGLAAGQPQALRAGHQDGRAPEKPARGAVG